MRALLTDLYQLTMAAGYFAAGKRDEIAVFELFVRRLPEGRDFLIAAGLEQAIEYLTALRFEDEHIDYLRGLPQFAHAPAEFWDYLRAFRFRGDVFAMREGTPFLPNEPVVSVRAPLIEAQIVETYLVAAVAFQTMIASKAHLCVQAAKGRPVVEFGTRRAHTAEAGMLAARAAYIAGCTGTSNVETGFRYGIPVFGTSAHSWVLSFESEIESYRALQSLLQEGTVYLIDSYDTLEGARLAAQLGRPVAGVRLDSGDLNALSRQVRRILDDAGLPEAKIMATGDLNEIKIADLVEDGAPIDSFGVGTELATSFDAPALAAVYKLVEIESRGAKSPVAKYSPDKQTLPGAKQVFRYRDKDVVGCAGECSPDVPGEGVPEALLRPVLQNGQLVEPLPSSREARDYCLAAVKQFYPKRHPVEYSAELLRVAEEHSRRFA